MINVQILSLYIPSLFTARKVDGSRFWIVATATNVAPLPAIAILSASMDV